VAAALCCLLSTREGRAQTCASRVDRANVAACALRASPAIARARHAADALAGRGRALAPLLPSNPTLSLSAARRDTSAASATNWYATLSQEVEIAGQRGARRAAAEATRSAHQQAMQATERDVAAQAWRAYFEALAARDALATAVRLEQAFAQGVQAAQAGAAQGLVSGIDADVAELTLVRLTQSRIEAERRSRQASAELASSFGFDPLSVSPEIAGTLVPLSNVDKLASASLDAGVDTRLEVVEAREQGRAQEHTTRSLRRSRVPNLSVSLFAQRDGFDERVLGGGVSLPVPLPYPLGRTYTGELAESRALERQASATLEGVRRQARLELVSAWQAFEGARAEQLLFSDERVTRAEQSLTSIAAEISGGRLSISSALVAQQTLIAFLRAHVDAKLAVCLRSVELARVAGLSLVEGDL
jgi:outer membrane protein, heavy metal efflux system